VSELLPFLEPDAALKLDSVIKFMIVGSICAGAVSYVYRLISPQKPDEVEFAATLFLLTIAIGLLVSIIKQAPAISFGLFGAMSIVRFRAQIKKSRRMVFLFMATVVGVCSGAGEYLVTVFGTVVMAGVAFYMFGRHEAKTAAEVGELVRPKPAAVAAVVATIPFAAVAASAAGASPNPGAANGDALGASPPKVRETQEMAVQMLSGGRKETPY
jgi:Domain of unknown function (DUF4956)